MLAITYWFPKKNVYALRNTRPPFQAAPVVLGDWRAELLGRRPIKGAGL
jgi:hypothetical protein